MKHARLVMAVGVLLALVLGASPSFASSGQDHRQAGLCHDIRVPVALAAGERPSTYVSGTFCTPLKPGRVTAIDILVHGATYDRSYWDSGYNYPQYSYVNRTLKAGRAVFYYDRLGVGKSDRLPSTSVTMDADAEVIHQLLQRFRHFYHTENLVGHSYGSQLAVLETSKYNDATKVVLTDSLHSRGPVLAGGLLKQYPANQDPKFQNAKPQYDDGWLTSMPGTRDVFYNTATADPNEIADDDAHKAVLSQTQLLQGRVIQAVPASTNVTNSITRPVLLIAGQQDGLYCGLAVDCTDPANVKAFEQPYYLHAASFTVKTTPDTGHDLALHPSAQVSFGQINNWLTH